MLEGRRAGEESVANRQGWRVPHFIQVAALMACSLGLGCSASKPVQPTVTGGLTLIETDTLLVTQPSDIAVNDSGTVLWTVAKQPQKVYQMDTHGNITRALNYTGDDLEGVVYDRSDATLWVAEESLREVVHLDLDGNLLSRKAIGLTGEPNSGLEGICLDDHHKVFLVNEKDPGMFIELNDSLTIASDLVLQFAGDYSGMTFDRGRQAFWIVSDQSKALYLWTKTSGVIREYGLGLGKMEGVAIDESKRLIYMVNDATNKMYVYRLN